MTLASWIMRLWKRCANGQCSVCRKAKAPKWGNTRIRDRAHGYLPLARGISARRLGRTEGEAAFRKAAEAGRQEVAVGLQHGDPEEPATTEVRVCAVDPRDGGQAYQGQVRRKIERKFGGASVGAIAPTIQPTAHDPTAPPAPARLLRSHVDVDHHLRSANTARPRPATVHQSRGASAIRSW